MTKLDSHIHIALNGSNFKEALGIHRPYPQILLIRDILKKYSGAGYTYLRDGGDNLGVSSAAAIIASEYNICYCSPAFPLYEEGNYGSFLGKSFKSPQELEERLNEIKLEGASFIKVMASGILDFKSYGTITGHALSYDYLKQICDFAHSNNMPVMAHANGAESIVNCILAGVNSIEHGYYLPLELLDEMKRREIIWVPTFAPLVKVLGTGLGYDSVIKDILEDHEKSLRHARNIDLYVALGSDAGASHVYHITGGQEENTCILNLLCNDSRYLQDGNEFLQFKFNGQSPSLVKEILLG